MSSSASLTITGKSFGKNAVPEKTDVTGKATFKKKLSGTTFSLTLTDATLRDSKSGSLKDVVVVAERKLGDGVTGSVTYDVGGQHAAAALSVDKDINGGTLTLKATYKQKGDAFILDETWKFDKKNKLTGSYNFRTEEAVATYTYSDKGWTGSAGYNFQKDTAKLSLARKQGKHTLEGVWEPHADAVTLTWTLKPIKAQLKAKASKSGVTAQSASLVLTQEFDL